MKVKELQNLLNEYDPNDKVEIVIRETIEINDRTDVEFVSRLDGVVTLQGDSKKI